MSANRFIEAYAFTTVSEASYDGESGELAMRVAVEERPVLLNRKLVATIEDVEPALGEKVLSIKEPDGTERSGAAARHRWRLLTMSDRYGTRYLIRQPAAAELIYGGRKEEGGQ